MTRAMGIVVLLAGCGRVGFDASAGADAPLTSSADASVADATSPDGGASFDGISVLFGDTTIEPSTDEHDCGVAEAFGSIASHDGEVNAVAFYYDGRNSAADATQIVVGVYTNVTGGGGGPQPNTLEGSGVVGDGTAALGSNAWIDVAISPPVTIVGGDTYWIAVMCPRGAGNFFGISYQYVTATNVNTAHSDASLLSLPVTWETSEYFAMSQNSYVAGFMP